MDPEVGEESHQGGGELRRLSFSEGPSRKEYQATTQLERPRPRAKGASKGTCKNSEAKGTVNILKVKVKDMEIQLKRYSSRNTIKENDNEARLRHFPNQNSDEANCFHVNE